MQSQPDHHRTFLFRRRGFGGDANDSRYPERLNEFFLSLLYDLGEYLYRKYGSSKTDRIRVLLPAERKLSEMVNLKGHGVSLAAARPGLMSMDFFGGPSEKQTIFKQANILRP